MWGLWGIWPVIAGTGEEEGQWKEGELNMKKGGLRGNIKPIGYLKEVENLEALN